MSTEISPIQKLKAELESAKASVAALTTERDNFKASVEKLTGEKTAAEQAAQDAAKAKSDAISLADKTAADFAAKLESESTAKAAAEKAKAESDDELAKLKAIVAGNPAFADAAAKGAKPVADVGASNGKSKEELLKEYKALAAKDPKAATSFYRANKAAFTT